MQGNNFQNKFMNVAHTLRWQWQDIFSQVPYFRTDISEVSFIVAIYSGYDQFLFVNSSQKNNLFASYLLNHLNISVPVARVLTVSAIKNVSNAVNIHIRLGTRSFVTTIYSY